MLTLIGRPLIVQCRSFIKISLGATTLAAGKDLDHRAGYIDIDLSWNWLWFVRKFLVALGNIAE